MMDIATTSDSERGTSRRHLHALSLLLLLALFPTLLEAQSPLRRSDAATPSETRPHHPLLFRDGDDPGNPALLYRGDGAGGRVGFTRNGVSYAFRRGSEEMVLGLRFEGGSGSVDVAAEEGTGGGLYRKIGADGIARAMRRYGAIRYHDVYDGIDIRYHHSAGALKYDCLLEPGADPALIRMRYEGAERLEIGSGGDLEILTRWGRLVERRPYVYQMIDGKEKEVAARFRLLDRTSFGFEILGAYDRSRPLVIDPMVLGWSTFVGGTASSGDGYVYDMAVDSAGNVYCTGWYNSSFPTTPGVYQQNYDGGGRDAYVFKLASDGRSLVWATYIGSNGTEVGRSIAVGRDGGVYIGGRTSAASGRFPTTAGAYGSGDARGDRDCYILKLSNDGSRLIYSSRFGGAGRDSISRIRVDANGAVTATGVTQPGGAGTTPFPTTPGAYDTTPSINGSTSDLFVLRLSPDGSTLLFSTLIGGSMGDFGADLAVDVDGETVVTGETFSPDFPTTAGAYQRTIRQSFASESDAFLLRLSADGSTLRYSTFFGGPSYERANSLALDTGGRVVIAGFSESRDDVATPNAFDRFHTGGMDGFIAIFDRNASRLVAASYVGSGGLDDELDAVVVDSDGSIFAAGTTRSSSAIVPLCPLIGESRGLVGESDLYVVRISSDLRTMFFADFIGGRENDYGARLALNEDRCRRELVMSITSHSPDFPTTPGVFQRTKLNDEEDQPTVMKIRSTITPAFRSTAACATVSFTDRTTGTCVWGDPAWKPTTWLWDFGDGTTSTEQNPTHRYSRGGTYRVALYVGCPRDSVFETITVTDEAVDAGADRTICRGDTVQLAASGGSNHRWSPAAGLSCISCISPEATPQVTTRYIVSTGGGCADTVLVTVVPRVRMIAPADTMICLGQSVRLDVVGPGPIRWSPSTGLSCDTCASTVATPLQTTRYIVSGNARGCTVDDTITVTVFEGRRMRAHMEKSRIVAPGDTVGVPLVLDDPGDAAPIGSFRLTLRYDSTMLRLQNISPLVADSLFHESIVADWRMTVDTFRNGIFSALFIAPSPADALTGPGRLLYLRFITFVRPTAQPMTPWSDSASIPFDIVAGTSICASGAGDPGQVTVELCGLAWRLIQMGSEKYSFSVGPPNPFSGPVDINFSLGLDGPTTIELFDIGGRRVATLLDAHLDEGRYSVLWDMPDLPAGHYYLRLVSGDWSRTESVVKRE